MQGIRVCVRIIYSRYRACKLVKRFCRSLSHPRIPRQTSNKGGGGGSSYIGGLVKGTGQTYAGMNGQDFLGGMSGARGASWSSGVGKGGDHGVGGQNGRVIIR